MNEKLAPSIVESMLSEIPAWTLTDGKISREFQFKNFREAFAFMTQMAMISEQQNHHPEWSNVYNRVAVTLVTHDVGGLSQKDFDWAKKANKIFGK